MRVNGQPVPGALQDPTLDLHDGNGVQLATNDNWRNAAKIAEIKSSGLKPRTTASLPFPCAFRPATTPQSAAVSTAPQATD